MNDIMKEIYNLNKNLFKLIGSTYVLNYDGYVFISEKCDNLALYICDSANSYDYKNKFYDYSNPNFPSNFINDCEAIVDNRLSEIDGLTKLNSRERVMAEMSKCLDASKKSLVMTATSVLSVKRSIERIVDELS